jgi:hypothetical protein
MLRGLAIIALLSVAPTALSANFLNLPIVRWKWTEEVDKITGAVHSFTYITTTRVDIAGSFLGHEALVALSCFRGKAGLIFEWSARAAAQKNLLVQYRFAGQPGHATEARYVNRTKQASLSLSDVRQFLAESQVSDSLYVRVYSDSYGTAEANFKAYGGKEMAAKFIAACPDAAPSVSKPAASK